MAIKLNGKDYVKLINGKCLNQYVVHVLNQKLSLKNQQDLRRK